MKRGRKREIFGVRAPPDALNRERRAITFRRVFRNTFRINYSASKFIDQVLKKSERECGELLLDKSFIEDAFGDDVKWKSVEL